MGGGKNFGNLCWNCVLETGVILNVPVYVRGEVKIFVWLFVDCFRCLASGAFVLCFTVVKCFGAISFCWFSLGILVSSSRAQFF